MAFFLWVTSGNELHISSLSRLPKCAIQVAKVLWCHKSSLVSSQKFSGDVAKVPSAHHKSSLFSSPKFPIFVRKVPFPLALSPSFSPSLSLSLPLSLSLSLSLPLFPLIIYVNKKSFTRSYQPEWQSFASLLIHGMSVSEWNHTRT